jgi:hypothetical protein
MVEQREHAAAGNFARRKAGARGYVRRESPYREASAAEQPVEGAAFSVAGGDALGHKRPAYGMIKATIRSPS